MKNRFERLSKKEQKEAIKEFTNLDDNHKLLVKRLKRLQIVGIVGIIYSCLIMVIDYLNINEIIDIGFGTFVGHPMLNYIIDACLLILCVFFTFKSKQILNSQVNKYLVEQARNKQVKEFKKENKVKK